ncbi:hypothetical protein LTR95_003136 [Oleoguttula sp. CCFEE 5521]
MTLNAVHVLLLQNHSIFKERTTEQRKHVGSYHLALAAHLAQTFPKTFDYENITKDQETMSVAGKNAHWAALKAWVSQQVDALRYLPRKGSESEYTDGKVRDMAGRLALHETAIHFIDSDPGITIKMSEITEPEATGLTPQDVAASLDSLKLKLAQLMGRGKSADKAPLLCFIRGGQRIELKRDDNLGFMILHQHAKLGPDTNWSFSVTWLNVTGIHDPLGLQDVVDPFRAERVRFPEGLPSAQDRKGTHYADKPRPEYKDRTDFSLITLLNRAGTLTDKRVVIGIVRPWEDDRDRVDVRWYACPQLIVTAGWDPAMSVVKFQVRDVDLNLQLTDGAGPETTVDWRELRRRGMVLFGRFDGATEDEIRGFAYAFYHSSGPFDKLQLPPRARSPGHEEPRTRGGGGRNGFYGTL